MLDNSSNKYYEEMITLFINNSKNIFRIIIVTSLLSVFYSLISEKYYESNITLYPAGELSEDNTFMSSLIAQSVGISDLYSPSYYIPDIIASRSLKESIVLNKWKISDGKLNLIEFWKISSGNNFINIFNQDNINVEEIKLNKAVELLDDLIIIDESSTGLISVFVYNQNASLASDIANYISDYVVEFVTNEQRKFASENKVFVESQLNYALNDLSLSEEKLTSFRKKHPITLDSPDLQLQRARYLRDVDVNQEVYITLRQQYEITNIEDSKVRLVVNVLDRAKPAIKIAHPKRVLIVLFGIVIGLILSVCYLFIIEILSKRKIK